MQIVTKQQNMKHYTT